MTKFHKANRGPDWPEMAREAILEALKDANIVYNNVDAAVVGYCYGDAACGQRCLQEVGLSGIPCINVNNNCSTGSTAIFTARNLVMSGSYDCVLALGVEKMKQGLAQLYTKNGWSSPLDRHWEAIKESQDKQGVHPDDRNLKGLNLMTANVIRMFGDAAVEHMKKYGSTKKQMAKIAYKNHRHSQYNPKALMQTVISMEDIENKRPLYGPLTLFQACATGDGSAAALICSEKFLKKHGLFHRAVEIAGQSMTTDFPSSFSGSCLNLCSADMVQKGSKKAYDEANITPKHIDVVELHDCFSATELMVTENLGFCPIGKGGNLADSGVWKSNNFGGELCFYPKIGSPPHGSSHNLVINPSGGLLSKGHPIGATGVAQCYELVKQLRGEAGKRQVPDCNYALQHNFGLGSCLVVTIYKK